MDLVGYFGKNKSGVVVHILNPRTQKADLGETEASFVYIVCSRPARAAYSETIPKQTNKPEKEDTELKKCESVGVRGCAMDLKGLWGGAMVNMIKIHCLHV